MCLNIHRHTARHTIPRWDFHLLLYTHRVFCNIKQHNSSTTIKQPNLHLKLLYLKYIKACILKTDKKLTAHERG